MPKKVFKIPAFNRGVVSNASPRDIPDDALAYAENVDSRVAGKVRGIPDNTTVNTDFDVRIMTAGVGRDNLLIGQTSDRWFRQYDIDTDTVDDLGLTRTNTFAYSLVPYGDAVYAGMSNLYKDGEARTPKWIGPAGHVQFFSPKNSFLVSGITDSDTSFDVKDSVDPDITVGSYIMINDSSGEIMEVTAISGDTLTVTRGVADTTATFHSADDQLATILPPFPHGLNPVKVVTDSECKNYEGTDIIENSLIWGSVGVGGSRFFKEVNTYFYGFSFIYDGFQESPLLTTDQNGDYFSYSPPFDTDAAIITTTVQFGSLGDFSKRITAINVYRADSPGADGPLDDFNLIKHIPIGADRRKGASIDHSSSSSKTYAFDIKYIDWGSSGASYEDNSGLPESLGDAYVDYKVSTAYGGYLFMADCYKEGVPNADKYVYRSLPKSYSVVNWIRDFAILPETPKALAGFNGRLYAFSEKNMYRINPFSMSVEDVYRGVGSFNNNTVVTTNYGMFHADSKNIYINDGRTSQPIGTPIQTVQFGSNAYGWAEIAKTGNGFHASLAMDADNGRLLAFGNVDATTNICWAYDIERQRWDLYTDIEMPNTLTADITGALYATVDTSLDLKTLFTSSARKNWKIVTKDFDVGSDSGDFWAYDLQGYGEGNFTIKYLKNGSDTPVDPGTTTVDGLRKATVTSADKKMKSIALQVESAATTDQLDNLTVQYRPQIIQE